MACYTGKRHFLIFPPRIRSYPCKSKTFPTCTHVTLEALAHILESSEDEEQTKEKEVVKKKLPCEDAKPPSKKKFLEIGQKQICAMGFSRNWNLEESVCGFENEWSKLFRRQPKVKFHWRCECPPELDDYVKSLWTPICKPEVKTKECKTPIDQNLCVFCLESLYTGGYLHEFYEKIPSIKKQSELYGDEVAWRIGIRTRVIVHKKCYDSYVDIHSKKNEREIEWDFGNEEDEDDEENCGEEEQEEKEEVKGEKGKKEVQKEGLKMKGEEKEGKEYDFKSKSKDIKTSENLRKQFFCLKKHEVSEIDPERSVEKRQRAAV